MIAELRIPIAVERHGPRNCLQMNTARDAFVDPRGIACAELAPIRRIEVVGNLRVPIVIERLRHVGLGAQGTDQLSQVGTIADPLCRRILRKIVRLRRSRRTQ